MPPRVRFRIYVAGRVAAEAHADGGAVRDIERIGDEHLAIAIAAHDTGQPWLVEVYDPAEPPDERYLRFGTDAALMHHPLPVLGWDASGLVLGTEAHPD
jgi:hypothetical protein